MITNQNKQIIDALNSIQVTAARGFSFNGMSFHSIEALAAYLRAQGWALADIEALVAKFSTTDLLDAETSQPLASVEPVTATELTDKLETPELEAALGANGQEWVVAQAGATSTLLSNGSAAAAAGAEGAAGAAAASANAAAAASAVTTTTLSTATSLASVGQMAALAGGAAVAAGGAGGGGTSTPDPVPAPLPPANPSPEPRDPATLEMGNGGDVHLLSVPSGVSTAARNHSFAVDLGINYGPLNQQLVHTYRLDGTLTTDVLPYRNISNVVGTAVNDQITGSASVNVLEGGAGDDIIYGDGGADILSGGEGQDWILFSPLTRGSGVGPYLEGVTVDLTHTDGSVTGFYKSSSQTSGIWTQASGFEHVFGSQGNDYIIGSDVSNILDGAGGDDTLMGGAGDDHLLGGASTATGVGNQMTGGADRDTFWVGYDIDPVFRAKYIAGTTETASSDTLFDLLADQTGITAVSNASVIHDWTGGASGDYLRVSSSATAVIGGLDGVSGWSGDDTVDLRDGVVNAGTIKIAAGAGSNHIHLDTGVDVIWTGYQYTATAGVIDGHLDPTASAAATDVLWGLGRLASGRDQMHVASGSTAVIGSLQGQSNWDGNDTVDLRTDVTNDGTIVLSTGAGNNTVYGSSGVDHIYGSANGGNNQVWGGAGADTFDVGTRRDAATGTTSTVASRDLIWDWQAGTDVISVAAGATAVIAGRMSTDWSGNDTVDLSSGVTNNGTVVIALGNGDDTLTGTAGVDYIYGGTSTSAGNLISGGAGADHFFVGYNYAPVNDTAIALAASDTAIDVIRDWEDEDALTVGSRGQAIIAGLYAFTDFAAGGWDLANNLNVSHATNNGEIHIAAGAGTNNITSSTGVDYFYVGQNYAGTATLTAASAAATDVIYGWDDQRTHRDHLAVASGSTAVIGALLGQTNWNNRSTWDAAVGWAGSDVVDLRQQVNNDGVIQVAAGAGSNTLYGSAGSDHFYVGYVNNANGSTTGSAAAIDTIYGWDAQAWSGLPLTGAWDSGSNWNGAAVSDATYDRLNVAIGSTARIGSLSGDDVSDSHRWDGVDIIDLRSNVTNLNMTAGDGGGIEIWGGAGNDYILGSSGRDLIYGGAGLDNLWGGTGNDVFYVGYSPAWAPEGADAAEPRIWDWQNGGVGNGEGSSAAPGDGLRIAAGSFAIIQGTYGMDSTAADRWSGDDLVDLRWDVINNGKIIVESSTGDDTIYGSSGVDYINPGAAATDGHNTLVLDNGGADRVYLDNFQTRTQISGFSSDDRIYLDTRLLQSFIEAKGITPFSGYDITASASNNTENISDGQSYDNGWFITSEKLYDVTYGGALQAYNADPKDPDFNVYGGVGDGTLKFGWTSNGAWNNEAHDGAYLNGKIAVIGAGTVSIIIGNSLVGIPFVGPILAIPFWVNGGLMLNDGINNVAAYNNPVYDGGVLDSGVSTISADKATSSAVGTWNSLNFLDFYNFGSGNFTQSLEIGGQQPGYTTTTEWKDDNNHVLGTYTLYHAPALTGVASYLAVYNGTETFIYLVASQDSLIQNNEAILLAQVNGEVTADQLVMYNGGTDSDYLRYFNNTFEAPVFPPNMSFTSTDIVAGGSDQVLYRVSYTDTQGTSDTADDVSVTDFVTLSAYTALQSNADLTKLQLTGAYTNDSSLDVTITFDKALTSSDTLQIFVDGSPSSAYTSLTIAADKMSATINGLQSWAVDGTADGAHTISAKVVNTQGFESQSSISFVLDTTAPNVSDATKSSVTVADTATSLIVTSNEPGTLTFNGVDYVLNDGNNNQATVDLSTLTLGATKDLTVKDIFGASSSAGTVTLGTTGNDSMTSSAQYVYGFGGNDTLSSTFGATNETGASLYGGAGNDTLTGGAQNNKLVGGADSDILDLNGGSNTLQWNVAVGTSSDSSNGSADYVYDFDQSKDVLVVVASGVSSFTTSANVVLTDFGGGVTTHSLTDPLNSSSTATFTQLGINLDGTAGTSGSSDLQIEFQGTYTQANFLNALQFDLTGTSNGDTLSGGANADTLNGGEGDDTLTGGGGVDLLTGGTGNDTFVFGANHSSPTITAQTVGSSTVDVIEGYDSITDLGLSDSSGNYDTIDLSAAIALATQTAGTAGTAGGGIMSHAIDGHGVITFDNLDTYAQAMGVQLADAVKYLQANILGEGETVAFDAVNGHHYLFQNSSSGDTLIDLGALTDFAGLITTAPTTSDLNYLYVI